MTNAELGVYLARQVFDLGDELGDKTKRIQFMGGKYPDAETKLGGLSELSLASFIAYALGRQQSKPSGDA